MTYSEQFKDPRWQKKRLEILNRDSFTCSDCGDKKEQLHVHHRYYISGRMIWEYPDFCFMTLCCKCHKKDMNIRDDETGNIVFFEWEFGLNHFGDSIFDLAADDHLGLKNAN